MKMTRRQRGAAMIEALVAIPFFLVIFALALFVAQFYHEKLRTLRASKRCAWDYAMHGCTGGCQAETASAGSSTELQAPEGTGTDKTNGAPQGQILTKGFEQSTFTVKAQVVASGVVGGFTRPIESTTTVMCDELPQDGNAVGMATYLWSNGTSW